MQTLRLAFKFFHKELRQGELSLFFLSIVIAVGSLSCIGFLIKRIDGSMYDHAAQINAAQLILKSSSPVLPAWLAKADSLAFKRAQMQAFPSMLVVNDKFKLAQVKAVSDNFPLEGELRVRKTKGAVLEAEDSAVMSVQAPQRGEIWLDKRLALYFKKDLIELGESEFRASAILERVPGQSSSFINIAPTALINLADVAQTATIQPGSRVDYLYFFSASESSPVGALENYKQWLKPQLLAGQSLRSGVEGLKAINANLKKAGDFLSLSALLTVLLAAIAIAINSHRYGQKQYQSSAVLLCLGCSEKRIIAIELYKLLVLGMTSSLVGILLGYTVYSGVLILMDDILPVSNAAHNMSLNTMPVWVGLSNGVLLLLSISMANLVRLKKLSPMALIRKDIVQEDINSKLFYLLSISGVLFISFWYTENIKITLLFYLIFLLLSLILYFMTKFLLWKIIHYGRQYHLINRLSLMNLQRHRSSILLQVSTFSLIFALLILIFLVRTELLDKWQQQFPAETPNHFVINVQSYETERFEQFLKQEVVKSKGLYPMIRGRLTQLNNRPIKEVIPEAARAHNALHRELNLSFSESMPVSEQKQSKIIQGKGWQEDSLMATNKSSAMKNEVKISLESELAKTLNIRIGDRLGFQVGSQSIEGSVYNIRTVQWDSFQPNFYIIFSPGLIEQYPMTWIASFYMENKDKHKLNELMEKFPGITIIEVDEILQEIQFIIEKISYAIEFIFFFIMAAGVLILSSSLSSTLEIRLYENAVIRTLGASAKQLRRCLLVEFSVVALLSAVIAIVLAELAGLILYQQIFDMSYTLHPLVWVTMSAISLILICGLGLVIVNKIFTQSSHVSLNQFV